MMLIKPGARVAPEQVAALVFVVVYSVFNDYGHNAVLTSGLDGEHSPKSLHYKGLAWDFRGKHLSDDTRPQVIADLREALGPDFDVVESNHGAIHIEFDPENPMN